MKGGVYRMLTLLPYFLFLKSLINYNLFLWLVLLVLVNSDLYSSDRRI